MIKNIEKLLKTFGTLKSFVLLFLVEKCLIFSLFLVALPRLLILKNNQKLFHQ